MTNKRIIFLLDKSGSMEPRVKDTLGGFESFVKEASEEDTLITLYTFSDRLTNVFRDRPPSDAKLVDYTPRGNTALYDAMGEILNNHGETDGTFIIMTDGEENASRKYTKAHVQDLIKRTKLTLVYAGADIDDAIDLGVHSTHYYDGAKTPEMFRMLSQSV